MRVLVVEDDACPRGGPALDRGDLPGAELGPGVEIGPFSYVGPAPQRFIVRAYGVDKDLPVSVVFRDETPPPIARDNQ